MEIDKVESLKKKLLLTCFCEDSPKAVVVSRLGVGDNLFGTQDEFSDKSRHPHSDLGLISPTCLHEKLLRARSQKRKMANELTVIFAHLRSTRVKAKGKTLMKWTPGSPRSSSRS